MPVSARFHGLPGRLRARFGPRATGIVLALLFEVLLALLLLTLAPPLTPRNEDEQALVTFSAAPEAEPETEKAAPENEEKKTAEPRKREAPEPAQTPQPQVREKPPEPQPTEAPTPLIELPPDQMVDISPETAPSEPAKPAAKSYGPQPSPLYAASSGDTPRVSGSGPNGEPLYAAEWYREPDDAELSGFLSAAKGPGWGMIACRTAPRYRVEDCQIVDEYPEGSGIAQAVQAAAFQFKVIPPRVGGTSQIGAWVRIRIDYDLHRRPAK